MLMNDEKRMIGNYAVEQSIHIGKKEVVFCVDKRAEHPYVVCYCDYNNPFSAPWPTEAVGTEDYLEAMQLFCDRVQAQIEQTRAEQEKFKFDPTPFTVADCIPDICIGLRLTMIFLMSRNMPGRATSGTFSARSSCIKIKYRCDLLCRSTRRISVRCAAGRQGILLCKIFSGRAQNVHARFGFIRGFLPRLKGAAECIRLLHTGAFARHGGCAAAGTGVDIRMGGIRHLCRMPRLFCAAQKSLCQQVGRTVSVRAALQNDDLHKTLSFSVLAAPLSARLSIGCKPPPGKRLHKHGDGIGSIIDLCARHGFLLLFRMRRIRVHAEQEREEGIQKRLPVRRRHLRERAFQRTRQRIKRACIFELERHEIFDAAATFHVIQVHRHELEHTAALFQRGAERFCKILNTKRCAGDQRGFQLRTPRRMLARKQCQKDLLFRAEIIVDRCARKCSFFADVPNRDVPEAHGLIQFGAGVYDLGFPGAG